MLNYSDSEQKGDLIDLVTQFLSSLSHKLHNQSINQSVSRCESCEYSSPV